MITTIRCPVLVVTKPKDIVPGIITINIIECIFDPRIYIIIYVYNVYALNGVHN